MNARRLVTLTAALALLPLLPVGSSQTGVEFGTVFTDDHIELVAGGHADLPIRVSFMGLGPGIAAVEAVLIDERGNVTASVGLAAEDPSTYGGTMRVPYHATPGDQTLHIRVQDALGSDLETTTTIAVPTLLAASVQEESVEFGAGFPGDLLGPARLSVLNQGNVGVDLAIVGSALMPAGEGDPISAASISVHKDAGSLGDLSEPLSIGGPNSGMSTDLDLYLQLPTGSKHYLPPGTYTGSITIQIMGVSL